MKPMHRYLRRVSYGIRLAWNLLYQRIAPAHAIPTPFQEEEKFRELLKSRPFRTVIDAGAHAGEFSRLALACAPQARLFAFEPLEGPYRALSRVLQSEAHRAQGFAVALGDHEEETTMTEYPFTQMSSLLPRATHARRWFPYMIGGVRRCVPVRRLDDVLRSKTLERPALLKIDVQGFEDRMLKGAIRTLEHIDVIVIETCFVTLYQGQLLFPALKEMLEKNHFVYKGGLAQYRHLLSKKILVEDSLFERKNI